MNERVKFRLGDSIYVYNDFGYLERVGNYFGTKTTTKSNLQVAAEKEHGETKVKAERMDMGELLRKPINYLLELYYDYVALYKMFKDNTYKSSANIIHAVLVSKLRVERGEQT